MASHMITTVDNPFDPSLEFKEWEAFDTAHGYRTLSYLARVARVSDEMSDADYDAEQERAMKEIVQLDPFDLYMLVPYQENESPSGIKH